MTYSCRAPGCGARTTRFGAYCDTHKARKRRHGACDQQAITSAHLKPHLKRIRARIAKNPDSRVWAAADERWQAIIGHARGIMAVWHSGHACNRPTVRAAEEVVKLADNVSPREVVEVVLAMYLLEDDDPRRFRSDQAFRTQLVRRVRALTDLNAGIWTDPRTGKAKRAYRDLTPHTVAFMASWLATALGPVGLYLARMEHQEQEQKQQERAALAKALEELQ